MLNLGGGGGGGGERETGAQSPALGDLLSFSGRVQFQRRVSGLEISLIGCGVWNIISYTAREEVDFCLV